MLKSGRWIKPANDTGDIAPVFRKILNGDIKSAKLYITAMGVYDVEVNKNPVYVDGEHKKFLMAPGWTSYAKRHPYQEYNITPLLTESENIITVTVGRGWYSSHLAWEGRNCIWGKDFGLIAAVEITYSDDRVDIIYTDETWEYAKSPVLYSEIYNGEKYDARVIPTDWQSVVIIDDAKTDNLIPCDGEIICRHESLAPVEIIKTPKGETVIDFGQNLVGRLEFRIKNGKAGEMVRISHAEVLDKDGNFYTDNLRRAKQQIEYICKDGSQVYSPLFTFMGFRYIRLDEFNYDVEADDFTAIVVHSQMKRTGYFKCSEDKVNKLFNNVIWGQKGNFLDVPTDCPQRDERLGWTGDAQVFIRAASYNFDVSKFFRKWLRDLTADQRADGLVPRVIPNVLDSELACSAWGDAATICPWQIYLTYGDKAVLEEQYESMKGWVEYIRASGDNEYLWNAGEHYGDWLGLDAKPGDYTGSSDKFYIAACFYAYSTEILIKASKVLGKDCAEYEKLYANIVSEFRKTFTPKTQTEHVLAIYFGLAEDKQKTADALAEMVMANGNRLTTGFVGTPYLLHVLSDNGYTDVAYSLLLQEEFPSWLYSVNRGATTIWEHWDGINEDGDMWSSHMNSFNHYAYGAVADWMYGVAAGIRIDEAKPGFEHVILNPIPDERLSYVEASIDTKYGRVYSKWMREGDTVKYEFEVPNTATIIINGESREVSNGIYSA